MHKITRNFHKIKHLIQAELVSDKIEFSLLLVHAEDHLMTTMTFKDLAVEIIEVYEKIDSIN